MKINKFNILLLALGYLCLFGGVGLGFAGVSVWIVALVLCTSLLLYGYGAKLDLENKKQKKEKGYSNGHPCER